MSTSIFDPIKNKLPQAMYFPMRKVYREPPRTPWGIALETLRAKATKREGEEVSQYRICQTAGIQHSMYRQMLQKGKTGPGVTTIQSLLDAMGFTWKDWAEAYEPVRWVDEEKKGGRGKPYAAKTRKVG